MIIMITNLFSTSLPCGTDGKETFNSPGVRTVAVPFIVVGLPKLKSRV